MNTQETSVMRRLISHRAVITLEFALGLILFASIVSGCFQTVSAGLEVTPGEGTPTLQPAAQPTSFIIQPTLQPTQTGLFPPTSPPQPVTPIAVAQEITATPDGGQVFVDPQVTQTLAQMTLNAQATLTLAAVTQTAEFQNTLAA